MRLVSRALLTLTLTALLGACSDETPAAEPSTTASPTASAPAATSTSPPPTATRTPEASATALPDPEIRAVAPVALDIERLDAGETDAFVQYQLASGEPVTKDGTYLLNAATGEIEGWAHVDDDGMHPVSSPDGDWLASVGGSPETVVLIERATGAAWSWERAALAMLSYPDAEGRTVFRSADQAVHIVRLAEEVTTLAGFEITPSPTPRRPPPAIPLWPSDQRSRPNMPAFAVAAPEGDRWLLFDNPGDEVRVFLLHAEAPTVVDRLPSQDGGQVMLSFSIGRPNAQGVTVAIRHSSKPDDKDSSLPVSLRAVTYGWDGGKVRSADTPAPLLVNEDGLGLGATFDVLTSPDGTLVAWERELPYARNDGLGGHLDFPAVYVASVEAGEPLFRAVRTAIGTYLGGLDWLADGSGVVVGTPEGWGVLRADGSAVDPLPFGREDVFEMPRPSPTDSDRFAIGLGVYNRAGNLLHSATVEPDDPNSGTFGPATWTSDGEELVFAVATLGGRDFGPSGVSEFDLPPRIETPPFDDTLRLVAAPEDGDCTELRDEAALLTTEVVACVAAGTPLVVTNTEVGAGARTDCNGNRARLCASTYDIEEPESQRRWLHVETEDGTAGWVQPVDVVWADP
ncbi:MAG: hypothetical protein GEU80_14315 [Dehalococcoidia bacterium]|nr:hypothetical protein [Dehalococcoidia bacterium]